MAALPTVAVRDSKFASGYKIINAEDYVASRDGEILQTDVITGLPVVRRTNQVVVEADRVEVISTQQQI